VPLDFRDVKIYNTPRRGSNIDKVGRKVMLDYELLSPPVRVWKWKGVKSGQDLFNLGDKDSSQSV